MYNMDSAIDVLRYELPERILVSIHPYMGMSFRKKEKLVVERFVYHVELDNKIVEWYNFLGECWCFRNQPSKIVHRENGSVFFSLWHETGKLGRKYDQPWMVVQYNDGMVMTKRWGLDGVVDRRDDLPAVVQYHRNGKLCSMVWVKKNKLHRDNGNPAVIEYYETGELRLEHWLENDKVHRVHFPAMVSYYKSGQVRSEHWVSQGNLLDLRLYEDEIGKI